MVTAPNIDWRQAWIERSGRKGLGNDQGYWNGRAEEFSKKTDHSTYAQVFLAYLGIEPGQSVMDMGCGSGTLAIPLARAGHPVLAADFSAAMLEAARLKAATEGLDNITIKKLDWDEDWIASGIAAKSVDVAIASRSTIVKDLQDAFQKLNQVAREKVCVTMATSHGPRSVTEILDYIGRPREFAPDCVYGLNLLFQMGYSPELRYVDSYKVDNFTTPEEALDYFRQMIDDLSATEERLLRRYLDEHLVHRGGDRPFELDHQRLIRWAFMSWEPR
jgi:SAM-dependent methyltransferase